MQPFLSLETTFVRTHRLVHQDNDTVWLLPGTRRSYLWDGAITVHGHRTNATVGFHVYASGNGSGKVFMLREASLGRARLDFGDPLEVLNSDRGPFPFLIGYAHLFENSYRVFAVFDNSPNNRMIQTSPGIWQPLYRDVFFNPFQKFQFIDAGDTVVAELHAGTYIVYDTLPGTERDDMKHAIALLVAFRHSASVLRDINDRWDPPRFHRFVYP